MPETEPWDVEQISLVQSGQPHDGIGIRRVALEKHRKRLVLTGARDGSVSISELKTLESKAKIPKDDPEIPNPLGEVGHKDSIEGLAWLPKDQRLFVSGGRDGFIKIWDAGGAAVSVAMSLDLHSSLRQVAISDQAKVACALDDATLRLVDLRLGRPVNTMQGHTKPPLSVVFGSGEQLFSGGMDGTVRAWDMRMGARSLFLCDPYAHEGEIVLKRKAPEDKPLTRGQEQKKEAKIEPYRFRSMGRLLGTDRRFEDGSVRVMSSSDSFLELEPSVKHASKETAEELRRRQQFSKDAERKSRHVFGPPRRQYEHDASLAHRGAVISVLFVDHRLLSCGVDGKVRCWDPKTGHLQAATADAIKGSECKVLAKCEAGAWRDVNVECGREEQSMQMSALGYPDEVCMIPEEEFLAVYSLRTTRCRCRLAAHKGSIQSCEAWEGAMLSAGSDGLLLHWRTSEQPAREKIGEVISLDD